MLKVGPGLELKTEESKIQIFLTAPDREIAAFKRVFSLDAFIEQATAKKGDSGRWKRTENATTNEYFVPKDGIDREVITADICRYLGYDALVRPGKYEVHIPT